MLIARLTAIQVELDEMGDPISSAYIQTVIDRLEENNVSGELTARTNNPSETTGNS